MLNQTVAGKRNGSVVLRQLLDAEVMLEVFRRELPGLTDSRLHITYCTAAPIRSRSAARDRVFRIAYRVGIEVGNGHEREYLLLGMSPVKDEPAQRALQHECGSLQGHPLVAPFRRLLTHVPDLQLELRFFPVDPTLPALAELTGTEGAQLLTAALTETLANRTISHLHCALRRYKPFSRAVLEATATIDDESGESTQQTLFLKLFTDDRGEDNYRELHALWASNMPALNVPRPLHYDPAHRMLVTQQAPGERNLTTWIKCIEQDRPLPVGVDIARVERCLDVAAQSIRDLQVSGIKLKRNRTFTDELVPLRKDGDLLCTALPGPGHAALADRAERLVGRLHDAAHLAQRQEDLVPSHGGVSHKELFGDEHGLTIIDWDALCLASPALDASTFLCRLRREPLRAEGRAPRMERLADGFRRRVLELCPTLRAEDLALHEAFSLTERALGKFRSPTCPEQTLDVCGRLLAEADRMLTIAEGSP
jgi:hypothetical protein